MSPEPKQTTTENVEEPSNNSQPQTEQPQLLTPEHLKNYPILKSTRNAIEYIPLTKNLFSIVGSTFDFIRQYQPMKYVIETGDRYSNELLNTVDKMLPRLSTIEVEDITTPIVQPVANTYDQVSTKIQNLNESVKKEVIDPTKDLVDNVREEYINKNLEAADKQIQTKVVAPLNDSLDNFVDNHFPDKKTTIEGETSEFSRTFKIVGNVISRKEKK